VVGHVILLGRFRPVAATIAIGMACFKHCIDRFLLSWRAAR